MAPPTDHDAAGLSIDMLDVDRLRTWSHNISTHGSDLTQWSSPPFVAKWLWEFADRVEANVRDVGSLRAQRDALIGAIDEYLGRGGLWNPEQMDHDAVRRLLIDAREVLRVENATLLHGGRRRKSRKTIRAWTNGLIHRFR
jgi:hypothetical protein